MNRLVRTRSQHFVNSPRRVASPLKHRLTHGLGRHAPKRRRVGAAVPGTGVSAEVVEILDSDDEESASVPAVRKDKGKGRERDPLSSEAGLQRVNRGAGTGTERQDRSKSKVKVKLGGGDVFDDSPRKRKREESGGLTSQRGRIAKGIGDEDEPNGGHEEDMASEADTGSWIEMDDEDIDADEEEPEFIAESDQHLLADAPAYALRRLRKAELIRLWRVAGMWKEESEAAETASTGDDDDGLGKKELVDGLIAARKPPSLHRLISPLPSPRNSPRRKAALDAAFEMKRLRSSTTSSLALHEQASSRSPSPSPGSPTASRSRSRGAMLDPDATPRAVPRTRSKVRAPKPREGVTAMQLPNGRRTNGKSKRNGRSARFGDDVKSPAHGLLARLSRRTPDQDPAYTTTDGSTPEEKKAARTVRRTRKRSQSQTQRPIPGNSGDDEGDEEAEDTADDTEVDDDGENEQDEEVDRNEDDMEDEDAVETEPTPLIARLRSRTKSFHDLLPPPSEPDADDEDEDETEQEDEDDSPGPSSRTRSRDQLIDSGGSSRSAGSGKERSKPSRNAKAKALDALRGGESPTTDPDDDMVVDGEDVVGSPEAIDEDQEDEAPRSGPLTRSQRRLSDSKVRSGPSRHTRRASRNSPLFDADHSTPPRSSAMADDEDDGEANAEDDAVLEDGERTSSTDIDVPIRMTRSGKPFGVWQSRNRKRKLRQEAMDDPDMDVDEDEEAEEGDDEEMDEDEEEGEDEAEGFDLDLQDATVASLTRLLRDELVQLCEIRGIEVGGTKPQLARALIEWRDEQETGPESPTSSLSSSSQVTARPTSTKKSKSSSRSSRSHRIKHKDKLIHAIGSNVHVAGKTTPVLLRDHIHASDPATPPVTSEGHKHEKEAELNLDLAELGLEDSIILPEHLIKLERIGSGGFKDVYVGKCRGRKVAISEFRDHLSEMDIRELKLLAEFSHPNIVRFRGICIPENSHQVPCMLVSELCENGDLFDYIRNVECPSLKRVLGLMLDIARGLEYLHTRKPAIIHRDCKSSNILINRAGQAKVGDFGLARVKHSTRSMIRSLVGTVNWQAPELWHPTPRYDYKVDVFSAAMVYWEMMSGWTGDKKYPWEGHNEHYIYDAVGQKLRRPSVAGLRKHWGAEPVNLMERMWHQDAAERPTMSDVVADLEALIAEA